jgi:hypothetical protein
MVSLVKECLIVRKEVLMALDYGICPCSGKYEQRRIEVSMRVKDEQIDLQDIPQGVCPLCGSRVYKTDHLLYLDSIMKTSLLERLDAHKSER